MTPKVQNKSALTYNRLAIEQSGQIQELHRINICPAHLAGTNLGETEIHARGSTNTNTGVVLQIQIHAWFYKYKYMRGSTNTNTGVVLQIQIHAWFNSLNGIPAV